MDEESIVDVSVGQVFAPDDTYYTVATLLPSEACLLVQEQAPEAILGADDVRAKDINVLAIEDESTCDTYWLNDFAVVVRVNYFQGVVTVVQRSEGKFLKKEKLYPRLFRVPSGTNLATW